MYSSLKELLINDYFKFNDNKSDDTKSVCIDNEQHVYYNVMYHKKATRDYLRIVLHHPIYEYFLTFVIISSSITVGLSLETDENNKNNNYRQNLIYAFDEIFIAILFLDFSLKIYLDSCHYWFDWTNLYDFIIILFGLIEIIWNLFFQKKYSAIRNLLKGFRLLQLIRLHRIIRLFDGLQLLTQALMKTVLTYTFSVFILVFLFIYIVAVIGQILYGRLEDSLWHHFSTSLSIATRLTLVDNWNLIEPELENHGSPPISRWFLIIIVFVGNRIVTNVLVGLMIESVSSVNDDYMKEKREKKNLRNQKKREELSKRTTQIFNTRASDVNSKTNRNEQTKEHIKSKLNWFHNEIISPKDFIFLIGWLEKLVACSEKSQIEVKSIHRLIIHNIQSLSYVINENMKKNEYKLTKLDDK
ncbi:unnamed protein product [Rotaria magnacalcarata]|uniref:Ion transport domain-containing protein n=1 Tax=Rotaria magnacalcarata TaxID=392030 RepID=A0A819H345_9BILA|nr:unnamed protein product [Rotaria magnacalcarata]